MYEISEMYELRIAQKYLMSPFFEKRIKGMSEFKDIFVKVDHSQRYSEVQLQQNDLPYSRFLTF